MTVMPATLLNIGVVYSISAVGIGVLNFTKSRCVVITIDSNAFSMSVSFCVQVIVRVLTNMNKGYSKTHLYYKTQNENLLYATEAVIIIRHYILKFAPKDRCSVVLQLVSQCVEFH